MFWWNHGFPWQVSPVSIPGVVYLPKDAAMPLTLKSREYDEVFTVIPVKELSNGVEFAPIDRSNQDV